MRVPAQVLKKLVDVVAIWEVYLVSIDRKLHNNIFPIAFDHVAKRWRFLGFESVREGRSAP
jgi:hypothetical protein